MISEDKTDGDSGKGHFNACVDIVGLYNILKVWLLGRSTHREIKSDRLNKADTYSFYISLESRPS